MHKGHDAAAAEPAKAFTTTTNNTCNTNAREAQTPGVTCMHEEPTPEDEEADAARLQAVTGKSGIGVHAGSHANADDSSAHLPPTGIRKTRFGTWKATYAVRYNGRTKNMHVGTFATKQQAMAARFEVKSQLERISLIHM